jgi:acetoin utilization protein AcuC
VWLWAFENGIMAKLKEFAPQAVVLQMGTDPHFLDPLGHLQVAAQEWLQAVRLVHVLGVPTVAVGGGGYELTCVPRMWAAAVMTLCGVSYEDAIPENVPASWGMTTFADSRLPEPRNQGREVAEDVVNALVSG